jgi:hypothetical protein
MSDLNTGAAQSASGGSLLDQAGSWLSGKWDQAMHAVANNNDVSTALHGAASLANKAGMSETGKWLDAAGDGVSAGEYNAMNAVTGAVKSTASMAYNLSPQGYINAAAKAAGFQSDPDGPDAGKVLKPLAHSVVSAAKAAAPYLERYAEGDPTVVPELAQKAGSAAYDRYVKPFTQNDPETGFNHVFGDAGTAAGVAATFAATDGLGEAANVGRVGELSTLGEDTAPLISRGSTTLEHTPPKLELPKPEPEGEPAAPAGQSAPTLRADYKLNPDGTVTGPRGGVYKPTGAKDAAGNTLYTEQASGSTLYRLDGNGATSLRPSWQQSEIDVGTDLGSNYRSQISFQNGKEVDYGTEGSVRPEYVSKDLTTSIEVKNYNLGNNANDLVNNVSQQAIDRAANLPKGMEQHVVIDTRGQLVSQQTMDQIVDGIVQKSKHTIQPTSITFK